MRDIIAQREKRNSEPNPKSIILDQYLEYAKAFSKEVADTLPLHRGKSDHYISLEGAVLDWIPRLYCMKLVKLYRLLRLCLYTSLEVGYAYVSTIVSSMRYLKRIDTHYP
jgi:hypothetical protein